MKKLLLLVIFVNLCFASSKMSQLLDNYKTEVKLSEITKSESAGFVDIYTSKDLQKMQARTLMDILKLFTVPNISRKSNNITYFTKPTNPYMPNSAIRLYINDHDMAASSYGSDALMWTNMSIEFIDHIVVYKSASSVEFGNEPGTVIIKLYTKLAEREEGGKVRLMSDNKGSTSLNSYYGHTTKDNFSYFLFGSKDNEKRNKYYNQSSELNSNQINENLYVNLFYNDWRLELAHYKKDTKSFLGLGKEYTPNDGELKANHDYVHISKEFDNNFKLQFSYDDLEFNADYSDLNGIYAGSIGYVNNYYVGYKDKVFSTILDKNFYFSNHKLLVGGFYKKKYSKHKGKFDTINTDFDNTLNLYSFYLEDSYSISPTAMFVTSFKRDFYNYDKEVKSQKEYIARVGFIKNIKNFQIKAFYTKTYYATPMTYLYSGGYNVPYKTNPNLDYAEPRLLTLGIRYKTKNHEFDLRSASIKVKNAVYYDPIKGFLNKDQKRYEQYEFKYIYKIDDDNKLSFDFYIGNNSELADMSPKKGGHIVLYNTYRNFDFYNELEYRSNYEAYGILVDDSYNFTTSIKYHVTPDFSIGIKGENLFDKSFKQVYKGLDQAIPIFDQKFWINMEYLF